jgi:hypothetical protein
MKSLITREQWLNQAVAALRPNLKRELPEKLRISCSWPSRSGLAKSKRRIGECWSPEASSDGTTEIFISPYLGDPLAPCGVLATLVHELVHAAVGLEAKHGKKFRECAKAVGLEGKMTATSAGAELLEVFAGILEEMPPYPHATLDSMKSPTKKQTTRMIKCECLQCGYVARTTKKWLDEAGAPHCPKHGVMSFEQPEEPEGED